MSFLGENVGLLRPLLATVLTVLFVGCQPPKKDHKPAPASPFTKVSNLSETTTTCEQKIRQIMVYKRMGFENVNELSTQVSFANAILNQQTETEYSLAQLKDNTKSLEVAYTNATQDYKQSFSYELSLNSKDSKDPMNLQVSYELTTVDTASSLEQQFMINEKCELRKTQTTFATIKKKSDVNYTYSKSNYYVDGESDSKKEDFTLPEGSKLASFITDNDSAEAYDNSYSFSDGLGVFQSKVIEQSQTQKKKFGLDLNFKVTKVAIKNDNFKMDFEVGQDDKAGVKYSEANGQVTWTVPQTLWQQQALGSHQDLEQTVEVDLPAEYFITNNSIELSGNKLPAYEHFAAYWTKSQETTTADGRKSVILTEKEIPTISGTTTAKDLVSNSTIQTELPLIQKAAKAILAAEPTNREAQVQMILDYLSKYYVYDHSMVSNNVVRPLTTEEALNRGKGVCQHYAVIFTAIARAMKIPTRIIVGFHLSETSAGGHAWNEVEIREGVWQVVEPQGKTLASTNTRFYLPLVRGTFLEDKDAQQGDWIMEYLNVDYSIKAAK
ncbi:transglutaminase-like domain-containing protein [Pseudobdellovibrio sp. HCB154]|uniref:transglutaminase-like domain-containing protein n=1 Tax=Pseudobdellovibrio sp. HCB154 TaxID=3386277 RepID=UPI0039174665